MGDLGCSSRKDEFERYLGRLKYHVLQIFIIDCTWEAVSWRGVNFVCRVIEGTLKEVQI